MTWERSAGWYADPVTVGAARYWDGHGWTTLVAWGQSTLQDPTPLAEVERRAALRVSATVSEYLDDALRRGVVTDETATALRSDLLLRTPAAAGARPRPDVVSAPSWHPPSKVEPARRPQPMTLPAPSMTDAGAPSAAEPAAIAPGRVAAWWDEARRTIRTDLALHGIAYLGVLLLFAGVTGLIVFSFGGVAPWVRSLTELLIPTALFLSAWYLSSRGAKVVGNALELLGGAVTPIVVAAAFTDGAPIPPDIDGRMLPVVQGITVATVAAAMGAVTLRRPSSPLRFLVGPTVWLAAGLAAGALRDPVPTGYEAARPDALQLGVVLAALALTSLACSLRGRDGPIGSAIGAVALPTAGVVYVLELVLAGNEGWPTASTVVTGIAAFVLLEASSSRLRNSLVDSLQFAVVAIMSLQLAAIGEPEWVAVGSVVTLLALSEYIGYRRRDEVAAWFGLAATGVALIATLGEPVTAALGFGVLAIWGLYRYLVPAAWLPARDRSGVVPAVGAIVAAGAVWQMIDPGVAVVAASGAVLLLAIAGRVWERVSADALWAWFVPSAATIVWLASLGYEWGSYSGEVAIAGLLSSVALALSALPLPARVWASSGAFVWALANGAEAFDIGRDVQAVALGGGGLVLVVGSLVLATRSIARAAGVHLAWIGHSIGLVALAIPTWPGWAPSVVSALAAAGWWITTLVDNQGEAIHLAAVRDAFDEWNQPRSGSVDVAAELSGLIALGLIVVVAASSTLAFDANIDGSWLVAICTGAVLLDAGAVRTLRWTRARPRVFEWATFLAGVVAALSVTSQTAHLGNSWSAIVTITIALAVIAMAAAPRPTAFVWTAWTGTAAITVLLGDRLGLDRASLDTLLAAWGAVALVGGVAAQRRRHGPLPTHHVRDDRPPLPPVVLGTIAFAVGGVSAIAEGSETTIGWTSAGMAAVVLVVALLLPLAAIATISEALATLSYSLLAPWNPIERPVTFVPWVVILLVAAQLTRRPADPWPTRWDLASFVTAHAVGGYALLLGLTTDTAATTFASFAVVALGIAVVLHRFEWALAAFVLLLVAGADAGQGWFALVLVGEGIVLTIAGLRRTLAAERWSLIGAGAVALVGAWFDLVLWLGWNAGTVVYVTVPAAAAVAFTAASGLRAHLVPGELAQVWVAAGTLVSVGSMIGGVDEVSRLTGGLMFAGSVLVLAATAAALAPLLGPALRWVAAGSAAAAWLPAAWAAQPSELVTTLVGTCVALGVLVFVLALHGVRPTDPWVAPASLYALATQALATLAAFAALPEDGPLAIVLLAVAGELVALGVVNTLPELFVVAPVAACGAWLVAARDTLAGEPNWFTVPIGVTMLVMVGLVRWIRRGRGGEVTGPDVIVLELVGMTVVVASPIAQILAGHLWNAVLAVVIGVLLANWGALTRVRWRAAFGAGTVALAIVLVIAVPLSTAVTWRGPALWAALSVLGITAILVASALERGRDAVLDVSRRLDAMTQGWERIPRRAPRNHSDGPPAPAPGGMPRDTPQSVG